MICRLLLLCATFALCFSAQANELKPFKTDGCSLWIDGPPAYPNLWRHCCVAHDLAYWQGGSREQRIIADKAIQACVFKAADSKGMANYMHGMIRWGGSPYWLSLYRWSYGWNYWDGFKPRGYKIPTVKEQQMVNKLLPYALNVMTQDAIDHPQNQEIEQIARLLKK